MDKKSRIYTTGGERKENKEFHFNREAFVHNLILFDEVIIQSPRLEEIDELIRLLGVDEVIELLNSKVIKFDNSLSTVGSLGLENRATNTWCHVSGKTVHLAKLEELREQKLDQLRIKFSIPKVKFKALERNLNTSLFPHNISRFTETLKATETIFVGDNNFLKRRIGEQVKKKFGKDISIDSIEIDIRKIGVDLILVESNLCSITQLEPAAVFTLLQDCFLEISRPFATAEIANECDASITLKSKETEKLNSELFGMLKGQVESKEQENLIRILNVAGLPSFENYFSEIKFDKIFQLRDSSEIKEFRDWNKRLEHKSDIEINEMFNSSRAKITEAFHMPLGKIVRIGLATAMNPAAGIAWALTEAFVLEQLFKRNSLVAFVNDELSSILPSHAGSKLEDI